MVLCISFVAWHGLSYVWTVSHVTSEEMSQTAMDGEANTSSIKICDLNLVGCPDVADMRADRRLGQSSTAGCLVEQQGTQQADFETTLGNNSSSTDTFLLGNKAVQVIDIQDDPPIEAGACDTSKAE